MSFFLFFFQGGALLKETSNPGYHMMFPFLTTHRSVQVKFVNALQQKLYRNPKLIPCVGYSAIRRSKECTVWNCWRGKSFQSNYLYYTL
jgi:hypothetical protein